MKKWTYAAFQPYFMTQDMALFRMFLSSYSLRIWTKLTRISHRGLLRRVKSEINCQRWGITRRKLASLQLANSISLAKHFLARLSVVQWTLISRTLLSETPTTQVQNTVS